MSTVKAWFELNNLLDDDQRLVYPEMYLENRHLYDGVREIVYLIKSRDDPEAPLDWVSELALPKVLKNGPDIDILAKQLVVRLRLPWTRVRSEWLISQEELDANREYYDVLDTFVRVLRTDDSKEVPLFDVLDFEAHRDDYELVEVQYLVAVKRSKEDTARLLGIDPDSIHTYMQQ